MLDPPFFNSVEDIFWSFLSLFSYFIPCLLITGAKIGYLFLTLFCELEWDFWTDCYDILDMLLLFIGLLDRLLDRTDYIL